MECKFRDPNLVTYAPSLVTNAPTFQTPFN